MNRMDQQGHEQHQINDVANGAAQSPYGSHLYEGSQMTGSAGHGQIVSSVATMQSSSQPTSAEIAQNQLAYQRIQQQHQQQLHQQLQFFWANQCIEIDRVTDFKNHSLPLARIKKIMKADEDVRMISAEAPIVFARACEMFILELTLRSWNHTEENKRKTLQKNDIAAAITRTDIFDFLADSVPKEDLKDEALWSMPRGIPVGDPCNSIPNYYLQTQQSPQAGAPGIVMNRPVVDNAWYAQQPPPYMINQMWPPAQPPPESSSDS